MDFVDLEHQSSEYRNKNKNSLEIKSKIEQIKKIAGNDMVILNVKTDKEGRIIPNSKYDVIYDNNDIRGILRTTLIDFFRLINRNFSI